jgi:hypothetical protein
LLLLELHQGQVGLPTVVEVLPRLLLLILALSVPLSSKMSPAGRIASRSHRLPASRAREFSEPAIGTVLLNEAEAAATEGVPSLSLDGDRCLQAMS